MAGLDAAAIMFEFEFNVETTCTVIRLSNIIPVYVLFNYFNLTITPYFIPYDSQSMRVAGRHTLTLYCSLFIDGAPNHL